MTSLVFNQSNERRLQYGIMSSNRNYSNVRADSGCEITGQKRPRNGGEDSDTNLRERRDGRIVDIPPLAALASRAARNTLLASRSNIPHEAEHVVASRRSVIVRRLDELRREEDELIHRLAELEREKKENVQRKEAEWDEIRKGAEQHLAAAGSPDRYCVPCHTFYSAREKKCSVGGCQSHTRCLTCECKQVIDPDQDDTDSSYREGDCYNDNANALKAVNGGRAADRDGPPARPSQTGYNDCWICGETYCNRDFEKHYTSCRTEAKRRCGFRPGSFGTGPSVCIPGHCGRVLRKGEEVICGTIDSDCRAICCPECVYYCPLSLPPASQGDFIDTPWECMEDEDVDRCDHPRCKECVQRRACEGRCLYCQRSSGEIYLAQG